MPCRDTAARVKRKMTTAAPRRSATRYYGSCWPSRSCPFNCHNKAGFCKSDYKCQDCCGTSTDFVGLVKTAMAEQTPANCIVAPIASAEVGNRASNMKP